MREFTEEHFESNDIERIGDFFDLVKKGEPWRIPTERLLRLNGNYKRGKYVTKTINDKLKSKGLVCKPTIENADYYGYVVISDPRDELVTQEEVASLPLSAFPSEFGDLISSGPDMQLSKVQALMISNDISQLPVLSNDKKTLIGIVTWKSIAKSMSRKTDLTAKDVMTKAGHVASSDDDFLDLVDTIIEQEYVLYRVPDGRVNGIVTASDLAQAFDGTAGIYIKLQELENRIRILLDKASLPQLQEHLEPRRRNMQNFRGASDMMFGEYLSALQDSEIWASTGIHFDQEYCLKVLRKVKDIRNGVMHFATSREEQDQGGLDESRLVLMALRILREVPLGS